MRRARLAVALLGVLGAAGWLVHRRYVRPATPAPTVAEIEALRDERRRMQDELRGVLDRNDVIDFAHAPPGNVLVGLPTGFTEDMVARLVTGVFSEVRLQLGGLKAKHAGEVKAKVLFTQKVGSYQLDVDVKQVQAALHPSKPDLTFGGNVIGIRLPVAVTKGRGAGTVRFRWDGKGLAGAVCGDLDVSPDVSSGVQPASYTVTGDFVLAAQHDTLVATPRIRDLTLKILLAPSEATWATLASAVEDVKDDKNGICRMAIRKVDVKGIVQKAIAGGFTVKVPAQKLVRPVALPARVEQSIEVQGRTVSLGAKPLGLVVTPRTLWYGVELSVPVRAAAAR